MEPERIARALLDHCELTWDPRCLTFHQNTRQIQTANATQVREPIHQKSVKRWERFGVELAPLREALGDYAD